MRATDKPGTVAEGALEQRRARVRRSVESARESRRLTLDARPRWATVVAAMYAVIALTWAVAAVALPRGVLGALPIAIMGSVSESGNVTAGIVGAKGRVKLGESNWFVPFYVDVGGGDSVTTWQAAAGIGYAYSWGDVRLDYRYMSFDRNGDTLIQGLDTGGLAMGLNFVF